MAETRGAKSGVKTRDSLQVRSIDHIVAWTFRRAKDLPEATISRAWVADFIKRSEDYVRKHWIKNPYELLLNNDDDDQEEHSALSQESKEIIRQFLARPKKKSIRQMMVDIEKQRKKHHSYGTIYRFLKEEKTRAFHIVTKPKISERSASNRLSFCDLLRDWTEDDFMFLAPSDEFFIYAERKANHQNDRIWAYSLDDIPYEEKVVGKSKYPACIGVFICFTAKAMIWDIKEKGESWNGDYFRSKILADKVIPFLRNKNNVLDVKETTFLHDKAPCFKAIATQQLLQSNGIDFFNNSQWPGSSPDLNVTENLGAILKDKVDASLAAYEDSEGSKKSVLLTVIKSELRKMAKDLDLFESLLRSYPARLEEVKKANGLATKY